MLTLLPSSRVALKKYVKANNNINATDKMFDSLFNKALKSGVEKGEFNQPKGKLSEFATIDVASCSRRPPHQPRDIALLLSDMRNYFGLFTYPIYLIHPSINSTNLSSGSSGGTKLAKKEPKPAAKPAAKKAAAPAKKATTTTTKKAAPKTAAKPKAAATKKAAPKPKTAAAPKKAAPKKPAAKKAAPKKDVPAVVEKATVLGKTKSGRVTKTTAKTPVAKKAAPKKPAAKKAAA